MAANAATKERLRKMRQKYGLGEYSKKRGRKSNPRRASRSRRRSVNRGGNMVRRKSGRRRRGGSNGMKALLKPFLVGAIAGTFSDTIPVLNTLPPVASGAAGGYMVKKTLMGAAAGAAGTMVGSPYLKKMIGGGITGSAW